MKLGKISAVALFVALVPSQALAQTVTMSVLVSNGHTPTRVGYNIPDEPGTAGWSWLRHSEINAARVWFGTGIAMQPMGSEAVPASATQFIQDRQSTRSEINAGPLGNTSAADCNAQLSATTPSAWIDWSHYFSEWEGEGFIDTFDEAERSGVQIHVQLGLGSNAPLSSGSDYWKSRWELWRHVFANAYLAGTRWNVASWQIPYNEPDKSITKDVFVEKLRLASDAVQLAVKTINKRRTYCGGPQLSARIIAPTTSSNPLIYASIGNSQAWPSPAPQPQSAGRSFCDPALIVPEDDTCYGRHALQNRTQNNFYGWSLSAADSFSTLFNVYSFHRYGGADEGRINLEDVWTYLHAWPGSPPLMPLYMTETNTHNEGNPNNPSGGTWAAIPTKNGDSPDELANYGFMLINHAQAETHVSGVVGEKNVFAFKFAQDSPHKTGMHHMGSDGDVGGVTNMGEVLRLFAKGFKNARPRFPLSSSLSSISGIASVAPEEGVGYVMTVNTSTSSRPIQLDRTLMALPANQYVLMETVSAAGRGNATHLWSTNQRVDFTQPAQSVVLLTIPIDAMLLHDISASADAMVKGGVNRFTNYGTHDLWVASSANSGSRTVSFIKMNLNGIPKDDIRFAYLRVFGQSKTSSATGTQTIAHVYGLIDDSWTETGITGLNAPNLAYADAPTTRVADNFVEDVGDSAEFLGHLTGNSTAASIGVDVTRWLKDQPDQVVTFMVIREIRFDPNYATLNLEDVPTNATRSLWMASRENPDPNHRPRLIVVEK